MVVGRDRGLYKGEGIRWSRGIMGVKQRCFVDGVSGEGEKLWQSIDTRTCNTSDWGGRGEGWLGCFLKEEEVKKGENLVVESG